MNARPEGMPKPPVLGLARELGEKLGGEPFVKPIPKLEPIQVPLARLNPALWPASAFEEDDNA